MEVVGGPRAFLGYERPLHEQQAFLGAVRLEHRGVTIFASLGNWEHRSGLDPARLSAVYERFNGRLLVNETAVYRSRGREVLITGFDDWTRGRPDLAAALRSVSPRAGHIALAHSPAYRDVLVNAIRAKERAASPEQEGIPLDSIDCILSGHTHGGQIAPFGWAPVRPRGSGRYLRGWYRDAWPPLYVSRGLGTSGVPVRLGASPELAYFEWLVPQV